MYFRYDLLKCLNAPDIFSKMPEECRIRVINRFNMMRELRKSEENEEDVLAILPSALPLLIPDQFEWMRESKWAEKCRWVLYSDHSSRPEIEGFLSKLKVRNILPMSHPISLDEKNRFITKDESSSRYRNAALCLRCTRCAFQLLRAFMFYFHELLGSGS